MTAPNNDLRAAILDAFERCFDAGMTIDEAREMSHGAEMTDVYLEHETAKARIAELEAKLSGDGFQMIFDLREKVGELEAKCIQLQQSRDSYERGTLVAIERFIDYDAKIAQLEAELAAAKEALADRDETIAARDHLIREQRAEFPVQECARCAEKAAYFRFTAEKAQEKIAARDEARAQLKHYDSAANLIAHIKANAPESPAPTVSSDGATNGERAVSDVLSPASAPKPEQTVDERLDFLAKVVAEANRGDVVTLSGMTDEQKMKALFPQSPAPTVPEPSLPYWTPDPHSPGIVYGQPLANASPDRGGTADV